MPALDATADVVVRYLAETSLSVAVIVAVVALVLFAIRDRLGSRVRYALWGLVVVRLLLPVVPASPTSILNVARLPAPDVTAEPVTSPAPNAPEPAAAFVAPAQPAAETAIAPPASPPHSDSTDPAADGPARRRATFTEAALPATGADQADVGAALASPMAPAVSSFPWRRAVFLAWLAGVVFALLRLVVRERRFARLLRTATHMDAPRVRAALARAAAGRAERLPPVLATDAVETPALTGVWRPRLLLPEGLADRLTDAELAFVFRHELAHLAAGDVAVNWSLALLAALHWFNPFVHVGFARLRAEREAVRDASALRGADGPAARAYGETLLRLLSARRPRASAPAAAVGIVEGRRDLRRRITMLARFGSISRTARAAGVALVLMVAAGTLTTAVRVPGEVRAQERQTPSAGSSSSLPEIRVERERPVPAWETALARELEVEFAVTPGAATYSGLFAAVRNAAGVNVVVHPEIAEWLGDEPTGLPSGATMSAGQALGVALSAHAVPYHLADGAVYVAPAGALPNWLDRRYYDVRELLDHYAARLLADARAGGEFDDAEPLTLQDYQMPDELIDLVFSFGRPDTWERDGVSISTWKALLVVTQSDDVHAEVKAFLELLLRRGARAPRAVPEWERAIAEQLAKPVTCTFDDIPLAGAVEMLKAQTGAPITVSAELSDAAEPVSLSLEDTAASDALRWLARLTGLHVVTEHGVVRFTAEPPLEIRCYEVDDILRAREDDDESAADQIHELIVSSIEPVTWDELPTAIALWDGMLVIRNTPGVHEKIGEFLSALRRALRD